jgi:hypothetical protein
MNDIRERFEAWMPPAMNYFEQTCAWMAWQAAEAQAVRRCYELAHEQAFRLGHQVRDTIRQEFPEAWK